MGVIPFFIFAILSLSVVGTVVYLILQAIKDKEGKKSKFKFPIKFLFHIYLYLMVFLSLGIAVIGAATAFRAALAYKIGTPFSYTLYSGTSLEEVKMYDSTINEETFEVCPHAEVLEIGDSEFCVDYQTQKSDLIGGLTLLISMSLLCGIHCFALSKTSVGKREEWLDKIYVFASLILYSVIGLISIPLSISQLTNFLIIKPENYSYSTPEAPAMAIGIAVFSLPLWIYFLLRVSKGKNME